jgi:hypothetical protein
MKRMPSKSEIVLLIAVAGLALVAAFGPYVPQLADYHAFADRRSLRELPFAMDVLSNLPFAFAGLAGLWYLRKSPPRSLRNVERGMAALFFVGLLLTAAASSWYHLSPDDAGLAIDRNGIGIAFAGVLGLAAAGRVSERAGAAIGLAVLLLAPLAIARWSSTGDLLAWAVLQGGGAALLLWLALQRQRQGAADVAWGWVIVAYTAAKLLELNDQLVFEWSGELVSGHTLKHLVAALAACPVIAAIRALSHPGQNAAGAARTGRTDPVPPENV